VRFNRPSLPAPPARPPDRDAPYRFYQREGRPRDHEEGYEAPRGVHEPLAPSDERARDTYHGDPESPLGPVGTAPPPGASFPGGATGAQSSPEYNAEVRRQTLQALNLEIDPGRDSWIVPVRAQTTPPPEGK
jgi:hypothetical protein